MVGSRVIGIMAAAAVDCECKLCMRLKLTACEITHRKLMASKLKH